MFKLSAFVLYVSNLEKTNEFYEKYFNEDIVLASKTFSVLSFDNCAISFKEAGSLTHCTSDVLSGGTELSFFVYDENEFNEMLNKLVSDEIEIISNSIEVWGKTFMFADPDGHRIRINLGTLK